MYDYIVVGAGSAGCVLASRLSADPSVRVLLLEAGGRDGRRDVSIPAAFTRLFKTDCDWNYQTEPQPSLGGRRLYWPRGKMLGGSSSMNAQMYVRGHAADYDAWAVAGNRGWSYADVRPYFERIERRVKRDGSSSGQGPVYVSDLRDPNPLTTRFLQAAVESGLRRNDDYNGSDSEGVGYTQVTQRRGRRWSAADAYLRPIRARRNLRVETDVHVARVVCEADRAVAVQYRKRGREQLVRGGEIVLCAGAINSPQLLLLSGIGPADDLRALGIQAVADLPQVGQGLRDHLAVPVIATIREKTSLVAAETLANLLRFLLHGKGMLTSNIAEATGFVRSAPELTAPDLQLIFGPVPFIDHGLVRPTIHGITVGAILLRPESSGRISLQDRDPFAPPRIDPQYLTQGPDADVLLHGVRLAQRILRAPALEPCIAAPLWPEPGVQSEHELRAFIAERAQTLYHPVGTCRMGSDANSVVDPELRVRGVRGLRVVDASVMPQIVRGNTHAPVLMLAEKAADLITGTAPA
jgi:choline dehydrogenase